MSGTPSSAARIPRPRRLPWPRHLGTFASLTAAGQVESALSFAATAVLIRVVGPVEAGQVFVAQSMAAVWFLVWDPRMEDAIQRFVPTEQLAGSGRGTRLYRRLLRLDIATGAVATVVGVAAAVASTVAGFLPADQGTFLVLAVLAGGMATPSGSASAGYALADQLARVGRLRLALALAGCAVTLPATLAAGPAGYLAAGAATGLASTAVLTVDACRRVRLAHGAPAARGAGEVPRPRGLVPFLVKSSATGSVAAAVDQGISLLAGALGGPTLVTYLKIVAAPGRLLASFVNPVAAQLHPRLARARASGHGAAVTRDALRASALAGSAGVVAVMIAGPLAGPALRLVYGSGYAGLSTAAVVLVAAAALRGAVVWGKVLPSALGYPGVRLAFVAVEGACQLAVLAGVTQVWSGASQTALAYAWAMLGLLVLSTAGWFVLLRVLVTRITRTAPDRSRREEPTASPFAP